MRWPVVIGYKCLVMNGPARCPSCGSLELFTVHAVTSSPRISFSLCSACEWRRWAHEGQEVPLESVMRLLAEVRGSPRGVQPAWTGRPARSSPDD
jgi:hypothetical protein